jgi:hypothetical protein
MGNLLYWKNSEGDDINDWSVQAWRTLNIERIDRWNVE